MLNAILETIHSRRAAHLTRVSRYRPQFDELPPGLYRYWAHSAAREFPGIACNPLFFARAAEALLAFFHCVSVSSRPCALPSRAADSVWHAWLRYSPMTLQAFCLKHYRREIAHLEAGSMPGPMDAALASCLVTARRLARLAPAGANLPPLFAADYKLGMPNGYAYRVVGGRIGVADMDARGRRQFEYFPHSLTPAALLDSGLVSQHEAAQARRQDGGTSNSSNGSSDGSGSSSRDGDSGDSGSGSSSDGASCGSGCGGD